MGTDTRPGVCGDGFLKPTPDPAWSERRVRDSFARQTFMNILGATLGRVSPGEVEIELPFRDDLVQQHGFLHAGVVTSIADSACGYAALSVMSADSAVLSTEFKINLLAPAAGARFVARGTVLRAGRTLTVCRGDVYAHGEGGERHIATMLATMISLRGREGVAD